MQKYFDPLCCAKDLDAVCEEAEESPEPEEHGKTGEQTLAEFDLKGFCRLVSNPKDEELKSIPTTTYPFRGGRRWSEFVFTMLCQALCCLGVCQTLLDVCVEPLAEDVHINFVDIDLKLLLEFVQVLLLLPASPHGGAWRSELLWDARIPVRTTWHRALHTQPGEL